jgi:hypothetical protein
MTVLLPIIVLLLALFLLGAGVAALFILKCAVVVGLTAAALFTGAFLDGVIKRVLK